MPEWVYWILGVGAGLWLLDAWFYRLKQRPTRLDGRGSSGALGNALLTMQSFFEPGVEHAIEAREEQAEEEEESGDPPVAGQESAPDARSQTHTPTEE